MKNIFMKYQDNKVWMFVVAIILVVGGTIRGFSGLAVGSRGFALLGLAMSIIGSILIRVNQSLAHSIHEIENEKFNFSMDITIRQADGKESFVAVINDETVVFYPVKVDKMMRQQLFARFGAVYDRFQRAYYNNMTIEIYGIKQKMCMTINDTVVVDRNMINHKALEEVLQEHK